MGRRWGKTHIPQMVTDQGDRSREGTVFSPASWFWSPLYPGKSCREKPGFWRHMRHREALKAAQVRHRYLILMTNLGASVTAFCAVDIKRPSSDEGVILLFPLAVEEAKAQRQTCQTVRARTGGRGVPFRHPRCRAHTPNHSRALRVEEEGAPREMGVAT